jgi:hypothetical protein
VGQFGFAVLAFAQFRLLLVELLLLVWKGRRKMFK